MGNSGIREARLSDMIPGTTAYLAMAQVQQQALLLEQLNAVTDGWIPVPPSPSPGTTAYNALQQYQPITRQEKAISPAIILDQLLNQGKPLPGSKRWLKNLEDWDALATQRRLERDGLRG